MKSNVFTSVVIAFFLFVSNTGLVKAESDTDLYHNVEQTDNTVATTYFKGNDQTGLIPYKKKVNILNEEGLCVSKVTYVWDASDKDWSPVDRMDYTYAGKNVKDVERYSWNKKAKNWGNAQRISYDYDENGVLAK